MRKVGAFLALAGLLAAGLVFAIVSFHADTARAVASATTLQNAQNVTCNLTPFNPTHFSISPGETATCTVTGTELADGSYTVLIKSSTGGNVSVPGTVTDGTLTFSYTFNPDDFSVSVCGTTSNVGVSGGAIKGQQDLFFGFAFSANSQGNCTTTTTTETTTTATTDTTTGTTTTGTTETGTTATVTETVPTTTTVPVTTTVNSTTTVNNTATTTVQAPPQTVTQTVTSPTVTQTTTLPAQTTTVTTTTQSPPKTVIKTKKVIVRVKVPVKSAPAPAPTLAYTY